MHLRISHLASSDHSVMATANQNFVAQLEMTVESPLLMQGGCAARKSWMFLRDVFMMARRISRASSNLTEPPMALQIKDDISLIELETMQDITVRKVVCTVIAQSKVSSQSICCVHALTWQSCQLLAVQHQESQPAHLLTHLHTCMTLFVMFGISRNNTQT